MKLIAIFVLMMSFHAVAALSPEMTFEGTVVKFDAKTVTLLNNGRQMQIDRNWVPKETKLMAGRFLVVARDTADLMKTMPAPTKTKHK